ncbi:dynamin family protein, partial [Actinoplanes sp. NPDC048791]|uniref:dynamin family protein n=1 Tax=Actinoplanes sp. NPDC048791 TaxID=3154623 RepID=UPI0033F431B8
MATDLLAELAGARRLAVAHDRPDLAERLDRATAQLQRGDVTVAVVGEFKQGKSTLVNALLRTDVCPVDPDVVTAVPTVLRYGTEPSVTLHVPAEDGSVDAVTVPFDQLSGHVTGAAPAAGARAPRSVE